MIDYGPQPPTDEEMIEWEKSKWEREKKMEKTIIKIEALKEHINVLKTPIKVVLTQIENLEAQIKEQEKILKSGDTFDFETATHKYVLKEIITNRFATAKFKKDQSKLYNKYLEANVSKRLTIKEVK